MVDAFTEPQVYCLLKVINEANITKSRGGSMNLELLDAKIILIFWVAQGPAEPPFMYKRTNKMLLHSSMNLVDLMLR